jgi:hypothetical protein
MMNRIAAAVFTVLALTVSASAQKADKVAVFVTSVGAMDGFTDPSKDNIDTAKDCAMRSKTANTSSWSTVARTHRSP